MRNLKVGDSGTPSPAARPCRRHRPMGRCWVRPAGMSAGLVEATYAGGESASGPALTAHSLTHGPHSVSAAGARRRSRRRSSEPPHSLGPLLPSASKYHSKFFCRRSPPPRYHSPRGTPTLPAKVQGGVGGGGPPCRPKVQGGVWGADLKVPPCKGTLTRYLPEVLPSPFKGPLLQVPASLHT